MMKLITVFTYNKYIIPLHHYITSNGKSPN